MKDFNYISNIKNLIPSNKGSKKESLYKKEILEQMNGKSMKNKRDKIRKMLLTFCSSVSSASEKNANRIFVEFKKFYSEIFVTNDYSFASVCSSQRKDTEKEIIAKGMDIFAKFTAKENKTEKKDK